FDAFKLDGIDIVADAQAALQLLIQALQPQHYQTAWKEAIKHAKQNYQQEVQRIYQVEYNETDFVPEIADHIDRQAIFKEFKHITNSCLTQSRVLGVINDFVGEQDIIVGASGSLPGDLQRAWQCKGRN